MVKKKEPDEGDIYVRELARKKWEELKELARIERENQVHIKRTSRYTRLSFWLVAIPITIVTSLIIFEYVAVNILCDL